MKTMYKIMIIDDERALRSLLKKLIPWEELHAELAGEAESGIEAINIIDDILPDIALIDIRMPFMDGLTFARYMHKVYPDMKLIIITAHQDFEYARQCIEIGVSQYLLKPVSRKELTQALKDAISKISPKEEPETPAPEKLPMNQYIHFIEENYADPRLNLSYTARSFNLNPAYFSRKFKEKTNTSFIDYLTAYRISQAALFAKQGFKMYQAAEKVGIPDANYFSKCFKKYQNMTYSEYVKQVNNSSEYFPH